MSSTVWETSKDGLFEIVTLTAEKLEGAIDVMKKAYFIDENVSIAVELHKSPKAIKELEDIVLCDTARDGCTLIAVEKSTGKVVAASFNKLQVAVAPGEQSSFEKYAAKCTESSSKSLMHFMAVADTKGDIFRSHGVDCLLEVMFMATLKEYRGHGLAEKLAKGTMAFAKKLAAGVNVKVPMDGHPCPAEPVPQAISGTGTTFITQELGRTLGYQSISEMAYDDWTFNGKTYSERIGPKTRGSKIQFCKL